MHRDTYIAHIVEAYIPDGTLEEKMELMRGLWALFDALYTLAGFDVPTKDMLESDSHN